VVLDPVGPVENASTQQERSMAVTEDAGRGVVTPARTVLYAVLVVTVMSLVGAVISVRAGLNPTYLDALGPEGYLSVPLPMSAFQILTALAAGSRRRWLALLGAGLLALAVTVAVLSGFFDGGYADDRLDAAQRVYQMVLVVALGAVVALAAVRFRQAWGSGTRSARKRARHPSSPRRR
jgi:hypothetical protein